MSARIARWLAAAAGVVALLAVAPPAGAAAGDAPAAAGDAPYWAFADRLQERLDPYWVKRRGLYRPGSSAADTMVNANLLIVHAVAALRGHDGPARQDGRARSIAEALVASPPFLERNDGRQTDQPHAPGWGGSTGTTRAMQHLVVDAEVAEALAVAWRARDALGLSPAVAALIQDRLIRVARGRFWRWPAIRLNQINWYAEVYAAAAEATGAGDLLRRDLRLQIERFARGIAHPPRGGSGNLGPGMRFHYLPARPPGWALNVDSAEYASIVASFTRVDAMARRAGMTPLAPATRALLRRWLGRVLAGYWTHAGYLNWDTGFGFNRWHQAKKLGLAQQALLGLAADRSIEPWPGAAAWAHALFDAGLEFYARQIPERTGLPPALFFGLGRVPQAPPHGVLAAARMDANAARAVEAGLGGMRAQTPPPLYAYDPDVGRLAVTTPRYSTAVVPVSQGGYPYGGIELSRLYDGDQEVAANVGGGPPASFGLVVRDAAGRPLFATQHAQPARPGVAPLRLLRAPSGVGASPRAKPDRAYAGPFSDLRATAVAGTRTLSARSTYRFTRAFIEGRWDLRASGRGRRTVQALFPSWGGDAAEVVALLRGGGEARLGTRPRALADVTGFAVRSERSGYRVTRIRAPRGASAEVLLPSRQASDPRPGPTLAITLAHASRAAHVSLRARIVVSRAG